MEKQSKSAFFAAVVFGLVIGVCGGLGAQTMGEVTLSLENDRYSVDQRFSLLILAEGADASIRVVEPAYPNNLVLISPPNAEAAVWEAGGRTIRGMKSQLSFLVVKPGIVTLGPFEVVQGNRRVTVGPKTLFLLGRDERMNRFPLEIRWIVPQGPYYVGQAIPLQLQVRNLDSILKPKEMSLSAPGDSILEKLIGGGDIETGSIGDQKFFHIPWGQWMLIPSSPGTLVLPAFSVKVNEITRSAPELRLEIQRTPEEVQKTRAVGEFSYGVEATLGTGERQGEIIIRQELKGSGNFRYLVLPELNLPQLRFISKQESSNYRFLGNSYSGSLQMTWRFAPQTTGPQVLNLPGFVWFSPQAQKVQAQTERTVTLEVSSLPSVDKATEELSFLTWPQVQGARPWGLVTSWWTPLALVPGLGILGFVVFFRRRKSKKASLLGLLALPFLFGAGPEPGPEAFQKAQSLFAAKDFPGALVALDQVLQDNPRDPGLLYNRGVLYFSSGDDTRAIHSFRQALYQGFVGPQALKALALAEERENLQDQIPVWQGLNPDLLWLIFLVGLNGFFMIWALVLWTRRGGPIILASLFLAGSLAVGVVSLVALDTNKQTGAVLGPQDSPIQRVPMELAESWMVLKNGTSLRLLGKTGEYHLVQTGYGLEGWVHQNFLMLVP